MPRSSSPRVSDAFMTFSTLISIYIYIYVIQLLLMFTPTWVHRCLAPLILLKPRLFLVSNHQEHSMMTSRKMKMAQWWWNWYDYWIDWASDVGDSQFVRLTASRRCSSVNHWKNSECYENTTSLGWWRQCCKIYSLLLQMNQSVSVGLNGQQINMTVVCSSLVCFIEY